MKKLLVVLVLVFAQGCAITAEDKTLVSTMSSVGQNNLKKWKTLSPEKQEEAMFNITAASAVLDHNLCGKPLPPEFQPFLDALAKGK